MAQASPTRSFLESEKPSPESDPSPGEATSWGSAIPLLPPPCSGDELRATYVLQARLDYAEHFLEVNEGICFVNHTPDTLAELLLVVEANRRAGVFQLQELKWGDGRPVAGAELGAATLRIPLPSALPHGGKLDLSIIYTLVLPARKAPLGYTPRQTNLGDWYPFVPIYRPGEGWLIHDPSGVGEHLVYEVGNYSVDFRLDNPPAPPGRLVMAASAPAETREDWFHYQHPAARNFSLSIGSEFRVLRGKVGSVDLFVFAFPEHLEAGRAALDAVAQALRLYSELLHPYPHPTFSLVEADFPDGMEYDGLVFMGREYFALYNGAADDYLTAIAAHETSHQWWYGLVGNDQALEPWLDEALATYSELLYYQYAHPELVDWWWNYRVNSLEPTGWVNGTIYDHRTFRSYVNAVYLRGALFLRDLRSMLGEEVFLGFLKGYAQKNVHRWVTGREFFEELSLCCQAETGKLWGDYFKP